MSEVGRERERILGFNAEMRKNRRTFATPDNSGHVAFIVPTLDYIAWCQKYPELGASDPQIARKAWMKFLNTPEGEKYKINPTEGRRVHNVPLLSK